MTTLREGIALHNAGRLAEAEACYRATLAACPGDADALHLMGVLAHQCGEQEEAARWIAAAIAQRPTVAMFHLNFGNVRYEQGCYEEAAQSYRRASEQQADFFWAYNNLGNALSKLNRPAEAMACFEQALALDPSVAVTWSNLGSARRELGRLDDAVAAYQQALERDTRLTDAWFNLGNALFEIGDLDGADAAYSATETLDPQHAWLQWNWSLVSLVRGDLAKGWERYEHRWQRPETGARRDFPAPLWQGEALAGRTIALWGEQGVGDEIMFGGILPDIVAEAGHCVVECDPRLVPLFGRSFPGATVIGRNTLAEQALSHRRFDCHLPFGSLPRLRRRELGSFPAHAGYLAADPARVAVWRKRLAALGPGPTLGLSWRSGLKGSLRNRNYMAIQDMAPLLTLPGISVVNLQYDDCGEELDWVRRELGVTVHTWPDTDLMNDFDSAAALLCALDHIVTPGNAMSALAGALGRPAWRFGVLPDALATLGQDYSPWFPSLKLAHRRWNQPWRVVTDAIARELGR